MKMFFRYLFLLSVVSSIVHPANAQKKIAPADVKKIILSGSDGGMSGGNSFELQVLKEQGKWNSYQTAQNDRNANRRPQDLRWTDSIKIGSLSAQQINSFLNSIAVIKPSFDAKALHLTAPELIAGIKKMAKDTAGNAIQLDRFITDANIQRGIKQYMQDLSVDTYSQMHISIVKTNNDTLKIETHNWYSTMLPWKIGKVDTYDMGINDFFIAATCGRPYGYTFMLSLDHLTEDIYSNIEVSHPERPINTYLWNYCYTDTKKLLNDNFTVDWQSAHDNGHHHFCNLKTNLMPVNMYISASVYLSNTPGMVNLVRYGELTNRYLKTGNFLFKYYANRPQCTITSSFSTLALLGRPNTYLADIQKHIPSLKNIDPDSVVHFFVHAPGEHSEWYLFPNNQLVMTRHYIDKVGTAFAPIFPVDDADTSPRLNAIKYTLFNADGTLVK